MIARLPMIGLLATSLLAASGPSQSATPAVRGETSEFEQVLSGVTQAIASVEESLEPLGRQVRHAQERVNQLRREVESCRQGLQKRLEQIEFVSMRLGGGLNPNVTTIGRETYSRTEVGRALDTARARSERQAHTCRRSLVTLQSSQEDLRKKTADYERLSAKLEKYKSAKANLIARWEQAEEGLATQEIAEELNAETSLITASDSSIGRAMFRLEALVSTKEAKLNRSDRARNIELEASDLN